jgi:hypothetical protein
MVEASIGSWTEKPHRESKALDANQIRLTVLRHYSVDFNKRKVLNRVELTVFDLV